MTNKIFAQFIAGTFGGVILGIAGFLTLSNYGAQNHGCWNVVDLLFNSRGDESCGSFGALTGMALGSIIGVVILTLLKISNYKKTSQITAIATFLLPLAYGVWVFWSSFEIIIIAEILLYIVLSAIPALLITIVINLAKKFNKKGE